MNQSRRQFLKAGVAAAVGGVLPPALYYNQADAKPVNAKGRQAAIEYLRRVVREIECEYGRPVPPETMTQALWYMGVLPLQS